MEHALGLSRRQAPPERDIVEHAQIAQQPELKARGGEWGQLEQARVGGGGGVERVFDRVALCGRRLRERGCDSVDVLLAELAFGTECNECRARVVDRGKCLCKGVSIASCGDPVCGGERVFEHGCQLWRRCGAERVTHANERTTRGGRRDGSFAAERLPGTREISYPRRHASIPPLSLRSRARRFATGWESPSACVASWSIPAR